MKPLLFKCSRLIILLLSMLYLSEVCYREQTYAQDGQEISVISSETYDQVLDLLFPRDVLDGTFGYAFVLRYKPSFNKEAQITILNRAGNIEVIEYTPTSGNIRSLLNKMLESQNTINVAEVAKLIPIQKRVLKVSSSTVQRLRESFYDYLCLASRYERRFIKEKMDSITITDDGTRYLLWYRGMEKLRYDFSGSDIESPSHRDDHPLIRWIKNVRRAVSR